jgi:6-phospho-3-hexuloisomerase
MSFLDNKSIVISELDKVLSKVDQSKQSEFTNALLEADEIFVCGAGRSGFMAKSFTMRLMHLGLKSYMIGETVTPNLTENGVLVVCSGSGETKSLVQMAIKAKAIGAKVLHVTINPNSTIASEYADIVIKLEAPSPKAANADFKSIQPMGSLFEQSLLLFLDITILSLMEKMGKESDNMFARHANLE